MTTYKIIRIFHPDSDMAKTQGQDNRVVAGGLTLEQAQAHCSDPSTRKDGEYFDGYTEE